MVRKSRPSVSPITDGVHRVDLASWREFSAYVNERLPRPHEFIFRGQRKSSWRLKTSLDRAISTSRRSIDASRHLVQFRLAARGRRGINPQDLDEEKWWALGQHYGLWTPLLDWTESPFVALYFAFAEHTGAKAGGRAVFALSRPVVQAKSASIAQKDPQSPARPDILEIITPEIDEIARLVSQAGLFTRSTTGVDIERWVRKHFDGDSKSRALVKIMIREGTGDRLEALRALNRMNINPKSLFPDIGGSADFCNMCLSVTGY